MKKLLIVLAIMFAPLLTAAPASAACGQGASSFLALEPWHSCLDKNDQGSPKISNLNDIWKIALVLLDDAVKLAGYVAAVFVLWGGVKYLKSQGDPSEIASARTTILNAIIGLFIAVLSVLVVQLIAGSF